MAAACTCPMAVREAGEHSLACRRATPRAMSPLELRLAHARALAGFARATLDRDAAAAQRFLNAAEAWGRRARGASHGA